MLLKYKTLTNTGGTWGMKESSDNERKVPGTVLKRQSPGIAGVLSGQTGSILGALLYPPPKAQNMTCFHFRSLVVLHESSPSNPGKKRL